MICPRCGNRIQKWAHGVCYTCQRTKREHQRYGRRRPKGRTKSSRSETSSLPEIVTCSECGQRVPTKRYAIHWQSVHYSKPSPRGASKKRTKVRSEKRATEATLSARRPRPGSSATSQNVAPAKTRDEIVQRAQAARCHWRRKGINDLLQSVYGKPRLLSDILCDGGLSEKDIERLKQCHLDEFLELLIERWDNWWQQIFTSRARNIIIRRFSLRGRPVAPYETLAREYRISSSAIERSENKSVGRLRRIARRRELEDIVVRTGREFLMR